MLLLDANRHDSEVLCKIAGMEISALIDSGAAVNVVTEKQFVTMTQNEVFKDHVYNVQKGSKNTLKAFAQSTSLEVVATFDAELWVSHNRPKRYEKFYVIKNASRALIGRDTAIKHHVLMIGLNLPVIKDKCSCLQVNAVECGGEFPKFAMSPVKIILKKNVHPKRNTYCNISPAFREATDQRLQEMLDSGIIEKVVDGMNEDFCSALLAVPKGSDDFRLVVDLRGPNTCIMRYPYLMPTLETIMAELHGSTVFTNLDLTNGFFHVELDESSRHVTNFFTGKGKYRYRRLPFGLCNAPDIFQEAMEKVIGDCEGVLIYLDDILIYGRDLEEHDKRLAAVMARLKAHNVKINDKKSKVRVKSCTFLGFRIDKDGYHITDDRLEHIRKFKRPKDLKELQSFLGLMNFVDKFVPNRADETVTLQAMVKSKEFKWNNRAEVEFEHLKTHAVNQIKTLGFFNKEDKSELYVDASPDGLGAMVVQRDANDKPRIIACASKVLTDTEKRYPQTQREALAVVWGAERFRFYLHGSKFTIFSDAEANEYLFKEGHRIGKRSISRAESWTLRLQAFEFVVKHVAGKDNHADTFSRLIKEVQGDDHIGQSEVESFDSTPGEHLAFMVDEEVGSISYEDLSNATEQDILLQRIKGYVKSGVWPKRGSSEFDAKVQSFHANKRELYDVADTLVRRDQFVVPLSLRMTVMKLAHRGHLGGGSMKRCIRRSLWWPGVNQEVENFVKNCESCKRITPTSRPVPLKSRVLPDEPMEVMQLDFLYIPRCGSQEFLMLTDTYSRMFWCIEMSKIDMTATNEALRRIFSIWGNPRVIITDNGPPFNSAKFTGHWLNRGVEHHCAVPYCPEMNGMIEKRNTGILRAIRGAKDDGTPWKQALSQYVETYNHEVPHSVTGVTPFELMTGRRCRGFFPAIHAARRNICRDDISERDAMAKDKSISYANQRRRARESDIAEGDWVYTGKYKRKDKVDAYFFKDNYQVVQREGPMLVLRNTEGKELIRSASQVKRVGNGKANSEAIEPSDKLEVPLSSRTILNNDESVRNDEIDYETSEAELEERMDTNENEEESLKSNSWKFKAGSKDNPVVIEKTGRVRRRPKYLADYELNSVTEGSAVEESTEVKFVMNIY